MTQTRQRSDMEFSKFIGDSELKSYINASWKELYDILTSRFENYYSTQYDVTVSDQTGFTIPDDFYKLMGVDLYIANGNYVTLNKWNFNERNAVNNANIIPLYWYSNQVLYRLMGNRVLLLPKSNANGQYRLWYIKKALDMVVGVAGTLTLQDLLYTAVDVYSDGDLISIEYTGGGTAGAEVVTVVGNAISVQIESGVSTNTQIKTAIDLVSAATDLVSVSIIGDGTTVQTTVSATNLSGSVVQVDCDGVNGWEEYIVVDAAIKCLTKEESETAVLERDKAFLLKRIEAMASNRDAGKPEKITDVNVQNYPWSQSGRGF